MGFFSWDCKGCNHSIREGRGWMGKAVVQGDDGDTASGSYDGYGNLSGSTGETSLADRSGTFALFHKVCFTLLGRPEFSGPSRSARDQGMPPADEFPEPRNADDLRALKELADAALRIEKGKDLRRQLCAQAEKNILGEAAKCPHCRFDTFFVVEKKDGLMIRCPNRDCSKLRPFPAEHVPAWRALAEMYEEQPVIWNDRQVGPHFQNVVSIHAQMKQYEEELGKDAEENDYVTRRLATLKVELETETALATAREAAE